MRYQSVALSRALFVVLGLGITSFANAQTSVQQSPTSKTVQVLEQSAQQGRFTFIVLYKSNDAATDAMVRNVKLGIAPKAGDAELTFVKITDPGEKHLVDKFGVSRAPMPMCLAIAPNGAVTGLFRKTASAADIAKAFVTPTMTRCMKAMQDGKIVLVCVQSTERTPTPLAVTDLQSDPQFKDRIATVSLPTNDPAEADFLAQLQIDANNSAGVGTVMLAPPGVLVGKFPPSATMSEMTAALHEAGKCCDDENCKHHKQPGSAAKHNTTQNRSNTRRN